MRFATVVLLVVILAGPAVALAQAQAVVPTPTPVVNRGHNPGAMGESLVFGAELGVVGVGAVFFGLLAVYFFMVGLHTLLERRRLAATPPAADGTAAPRRPEISSEVAHAIALALFMDLRTFDEEEAEEITIKKITRPFSPWMDSWKTGIMLANQKMYRK